MSVELSIRDHGELQAAVARATLAGGAYGLCAWRFPGPASTLLGLLAIGLAAVPPRTLRSAALACGIAMFAAIASLLPGLAGGLGLACIGGLTFSRDLDGATRKLVAATAGAIGLATGWFVAGTIGASGALAGIAPGLGALVLGGAAGFIASLGATGRELAWTEAPSPGALPPAPATAAPSDAPALGAVGALQVAPAAEIAVAPGEIAGLLARATTAFREARTALADDAPEASAAAEDLVARIGRFGRRWSDLETESARTDRLGLATRLDAIVKREESATDDVVRDEYGRARAALRAQLEYLDGIERGRDRAIARLHHHIAVLERLRLAALHHRSADAARVGEELAPLVDDLTSAGRELDVAAEVLAELPAFAS